MILEKRRACKILPYNFLLSKNCQKIVQLKLPDWKSEAVTNLSFMAREPEFLIPRQTPVLRTSLKRLISTFLPQLSEIFFQILNKMS